MGGCASVTLWRHVHVSAVLLRIPRKSSAWLKMFFWLSRHAPKIESLHLADESAFMDNSLDAIKMGALALLTRNLKILHLDNCFHRGRARLMRIFDQGLCRSKFRYGQFVVLDEKIGAVANLQRQS